MKKIINKIKQNQNLCKVLKVLKLVLDLVVYGFAIFMIVGLAIGQSQVHNDRKAQERQLIPNVATIPLKNSIQDRYAVFYSLGDFCGEAFAEETYKLLTDNTMTNIALTGKSYENFLSGDVITVDSTDMLIGTLDNTGDNITWITSNMVFTDFTIQKLNSYSYPVYKMSYTRVSYNRYYYRYTFYYARYSIYNNDNQLTYFNWSTSVYYEYKDGLNSSWVARGFDITDFREYYAIPKNNYFNWIGTGESKLNDYYNNGYNDGYSRGKEYGQSIGEQEGYNDGYYAGLQAAEEGETTMFSLISRAFNAIASILDIQILPNLSLGLLIFTPIIVSIIILIIKMVKG